MSNLIHESKDYKVVTTLLDNLNILEIAKELNWDVQECQKQTIPTLTK